MFGCEGNDLTYCGDLVKLFTKGLVPVRHKCLVELAEQGSEKPVRTFPCTAGQHAEAEREPREEPASGTRWFLFDNVL